MCAFMPLGVRMPSGIFLPMLNSICAAGVRRTAQAEGNPTLAPALSIRLKKYGRFSTSGVLSGHLVRHN
jgi:hypothetical protein